MSEQASTPRALRGLVLGFTLSAVNLAGAFLTVLALGGLAPWTSWQFIGLFGVLEVATGIGFIVGPNIWHLPVAAGKLQNRTLVRLAASTIFIPHWAAGAKTLAGLALVGAALWNTGIGFATVALLPLIVFIVAWVVGASLIAARWGVARPDLDVLFIDVRRPGKPAYELPGFSISASVVQLLINLGPFPAVKIFSPSLFYRPEMAPSPALLAWTGGIAVALMIVGLASWRGRIGWRAPRPQQREAEKFA